MQTASEENRKLVSREFEFKALSAKCAQVSSEKNIWTEGDARSSVRLNAINRFFQTLVAAPCSKDAEGVLYQNPFQNVRLNVLSEQTSTGVAATVLAGVLYDLDYGLNVVRSDGTTLCSDGWISSSRGRGTCSHHGGYAHPRGTRIDYQSFPIIRDPAFIDTSGLPFQMITSPFHTLWRAIFSHLLHNSGGLWSVLGLLIFFLVTTWPIIIFWTLVRRAVIKDKQALSVNDSALIGDPISNTVPKTSQTLGDHEEISKNAKPKRPIKPRYKLPVSTFDSYVMAAWLNAAEIEALTRAVRSEADEEICDTNDQIVGWVRVRGTKEFGLHDHEFGLERHRNGKSIVIAWFSQAEIELLMASLTGHWDSKFDITSDPPHIRTAYVDPNAPDGMAGQPSVRLYRLKIRS